MPKPGLATDTWAHYDHLVWLKTLRAKYTEYKKFKVSTLFREMEEAVGCTDRQGQSSVGGAEEYLLDVRAIGHDLRRGPVYDCRRVRHALPGSHTHNSFFALCCPVHFANYLLNCAQP